MRVIGDATCDLRRALSETRHATCDARYRRRDMRLATRVIGDATCDFRRALSETRHALTEAGDAFFTGTFCDVADIVLSLGALNLSDGD